MTEAWRQRRRDPLTRRRDHEDKDPPSPDSIHHLATKKKTQLELEFKTSIHAAKIIDGISVAKQVRDGIIVEISRMKDTVGVIPGLAVILVGDKEGFCNLFTQQEEKL